MIKWKREMQESYNLYLDDLREPSQSFKKTGDSRYNDLKWKIVRCYSEFVETIALNGIPNIVSFDHDLGEEHINYYFDNGGRENPPDPLKGHFTEKTGYDCAKWLVEYCSENGLPMPTYLIHSANPVGSQNIRFILENYTKKHPFS
jgi:hypothetical protein